MEAWGRFTARGGAAVEKSVTEMMRSIREQLDRALEYGSYRAVVLIGGYGRGEGGVDRSGGEEAPHNNFDLLIIAEKNALELKERAERALVNLAGVNVGVDVGAITSKQLRNAPTLVMWYDMRHGHKHLLGDSTYVPSLAHFKLNSIPAWDVRNLLVNRGTLLIINERLLARDKLSDKEKRVVIKHGIKAVIGYGDALLYFLGQYDWSYREKQHRMARAHDVEQHFRELYDEAMEFRFEPRYPEYLEKDLRIWNRELRNTLARVHLRVESMRLGTPHLSWAHYVENAFVQHLLEDKLRPRAYAKKISALRSPRGVMQVLGQRAKLGYLTARPRERLPIVFPAAVYDDMPQTLTQAAAGTLHAQDSSPATLQKAYLKAWGDHGDTNFKNVLRELHIAL